VYKLLHRVSTSTAMGHCLSRGVNISRLENMLSQFLLRERIAPSPSPSLASQIIPSLPAYGRSQHHARARIGLARIKIIPTYPLRNVCVHIIARDLFNALLVFSLADYITTSASSLVAETHASSTARHSHREGPYPPVESRYGRQQVVHTSTPLTHSGVSCPFFGLSTVECWSGGPLLLCKTWSNS
jgi:hypothetical protein